MNNTNVGGVFITVGLDTQDIANQARAAAAQVNAAFASGGVTGVGAKITDDLTAAGAAGVAAANATSAAFKETEAVVSNIVATGRSAAGMLLPDAGATASGVADVNRIYEAQIALFQQVRKDSEDLANQEINDAERAAEAQIKAAQQATEVQNRFRERQISPQFAATMQAGFGGAAAAQDEIIRMESQTARAIQEGEAQIQKAREQSLIQIDKQAAAEVEANQKRIASERQAQEAASARTGSASAFGGISQLAFGASLASNGAAISGTAMAANGLRTSLMQLEGVSTGAATATAGVAAGVIAVGVASEKATKAVVGFVSSVVQSAADLEKQAISFTVLTGSVENARNEFTKLQALAVESPFNIEDFTQLDKFLLSVDIGSKQLREDLVGSISDIGAAFGFGADRLQLIAFALAQVQAAGRLTGDEARQLRNQMIPYVEVLKSIPKFADMGSAQIKKMMEDGKVSSTDFFNATVAWSKQFSGAAQAQAHTVQGLIENIKEAVKQTAAIQAGPVAFGGQDVLAPVRNILETVKKLVQSIDWAPLAAGIKAFFTALTGGVTDAVGDTNKIVTFFEVVLPNAINTAGAAIRPFLDLLVTLGSSLVGIIPTQGFDDATSSLQGLAIVLNVIMAPIKLLASTLVIAFDTMAVAINAFYDIAKVVFEGLKFLVDEAVATILKGADLAIQFATKIPGTKSALKLAGIDADKIHEESQKASKASDNAYKDMTDATNKGFSDFVSKTKHIATDQERIWSNWATVPKLAIAAAPPPTADDWFSKWEDMRSGIDQEIANIQDQIAQNDADNAKKLADAAKKAAEDRANLIHQLFEMSKSWFGQPSELQQGFFGGNEFTASVEQIASMGKKLGDMMADLGRNDIVNLIDTQTRKLLALAEMRDVIADKLKDAEQKLNDAMQKRNDFIVSLRDSSIAFVNALQQDNETITEVIRTASGFIEVDRKKTTGFVQGLKDRLAALKKFIAQIKQLAARGLDQDLLQQLITAGPDQAGTVVDELAQSGDDVIGEVNGIQADLKQTANTYGFEIGVKFYQAGVDMTQGLVNGLKSQQAAITAAAQGAFNALIGPVISIANAGTLAGKGFGTNFAKGVADGVKAAGVSLSKFQLAVIDMEAKSAPLEAMRANLQAQLTALQLSPLGGGPALANVTAALDNIMTMLRALWLPFLMGQAPGSVVAGLSASPMAVSVSIGGEKIHEIASAELSYANDSAALSASTGTRHG